jgi:AGCS family alanine or glycine:cation symporter
MFTYGYYGERCFAFLFGETKARHYKYFYITMIAVGCTFTLDFVFNVMMGMYALMAIPTMLSALILAPKVMAAARVYFEGLEK